ncbi:unnamed protein product [Hydatigera taeniaeformis]|uniref:EOG090X0AI9 n=1 Tax=Hydatigena taeniaeformis TaxID=6205 RepID=A0A0R3X6X0_HYDTA|nr:unnamed protein product [Hydatigera taeniaeformis]
MLRLGKFACEMVCRHFKELKSIRFPILHEVRRGSQSSPSKRPVSLENAIADEDDVIEVFDLPVEPQFEENPEFDMTLGSHGGVFDLPEIVQFLRVENFSDIVSIRIPETVCYGNFMVIATAKSSNHVSQTSKILHQLFKIKRASSDPFPSFEGLEERADWVAVDFGNIILHMFTKVECRQMYDLESLWGIGPEFDEKTQELESSKAQVDFPYSMNLTQADWERIVADATAE